MPPQKFAVPLFLLFCLALLFLPHQPAHTSKAQVSRAYSIGHSPTVFASLGTPSAGQQWWCSDCAATSPCTGGGSGAFASGIGTQWNCSTGTAGASNPFDDGTALVKGSADATKLLRFEVDGFTAGATRVVTFPDADTSVARTNGTNTFSSTQTFSGDIAPNRISFGTSGFVKASATNIIAFRDSADTGFGGVRVTRLMVSDSSENIRIGVGQTGNNIELTSGGEINVAASSTQSNTAKVLGLKMLEAGAWSVTNGGAGGGTVKIGDPGAKPTCDSTRRGMLWIDEGAGGVKDSVEVCAKDAGDAYAWRTLY